MLEILKKLEHVQELDIQIDTILRKKAEFPKRLNGFEQEIKALNTKYEEKKKVVDELEKAKRQQTGALELNDDRLKRSQEKLEQIKTNQEYQALQKEVESLKKNSAAIQENAKKVSDEHDKHKLELDQIQNALNEVKAKLEKESNSISGETQGLDSDLSKLQEARKGAIIGIDNRYLSAYDRIRGGKFGIGLASASGGNCKACNLRIPPQIYNELQRGSEMHVCPNCKRILIYKDPIKGSDTDHTASVH